MSTTVGREAALDELGRLLALWPGVHIEVNRWSATGDLVFIELTMVATVAGQPLRIPAMDRILLQDGLVIERVTYVDSLPVLMALLKHPSECLRWLRSRVQALQAPLPAARNAGSRSSASSRV